MDAYLSLVSFLPPGKEPTESYNKRLKVDHSYNILDLQFIDKLNDYTIKDEEKKGGKEDNSTIKFKIKNVYIIT